MARLILTVISISLIIHTASDNIFDTDQGIELMKLSFLDHSNIRSAESKIICQFSVTLVVMKSA